MTVDLNLDKDGVVAEVGMLVQACAYGQAASAIFGKNALGRSRAELIVMRDELAKWIAGEGTQPVWPDIERLEPERLNIVRKAAVQLVFEAAVEAADSATVAYKNE